MPDIEKTAKITVTVEGVGDGETRTISQEVAEHISDLIRTDLAERYTDIHAGERVDVLALTAPNQVTILRDEESDGE